MLAIYPDHSLTALAGMVFTIPKEQNAKCLICVERGRLTYIHCSDCERFCFETGFTDLNQEFTRSIPGRCFQNCVYELWMTAKDGFLCRNSQQAVSAHGHQCAPLRRSDNTHKDMISIFSGLYQIRKNGTQCGSFNSGNVVLSNGLLVVESDGVSRQLQDWIEFNYRTRRKR